MQMSGNPEQSGFLTYADIQGVLGQLGIGTSMGSRPAEAEEPGMRWLLRLVLRVAIAAVAVKVIRRVLRNLG